MVDKTIHTFLKDNPETENILYNLFNGYKNTEFAKIYTKLNTKETSGSFLFNHCIKHHKLLNTDFYNRKCNIEEINNYTILNNININNYIKIKNNISEIKKLTSHCLKQILDTKLIKINSKNIKLSNCIIADFLSSNGNSEFSDFHTDVTYGSFIGQCFNVWYLVKNKKKYGNMFLLENDEYKESYTPCRLYDDINKNNKITFYKSTITGLISNYNEKIGEFDIKKMKFKYLNILNGECLVMSKHQLHRTDLRRRNINNEDFEAFNFRVIVKDDDGSIPHNGDTKFIHTKHTYDKKNKKLFGVETFDFL